VGGPTTAATGSGSDQVAHHPAAAAAAFVEHVPGATPGRWTVEKVPVSPAGVLHLEGRLEADHHDGVAIHHHPREHLLPGGEIRWAGPEFAGWPSILTENLYCSLRLGPHISVDEPCAFHDFRLAAGLLGIRTAPRVGWQIG
jgi:hypothetical protein